MSWRKTAGTAVLVGLATVSAIWPAAAQATRPAMQAAVSFPGTSGQSGARGYWFYQSPPVNTHHIQPAPRPRAVTAAPARKRACRHTATWTARCGFLTPHSFAFQARERDALLHRMVIHPNSQKAVKAVQRYTRWVVDQAITATRMWQYNTVQDPSLSGTATAPISTYGLRLAFSTHSLNKAAAWQAIRRFGGVLILFTKADCPYCQGEVPPMQGFERDTGLTIWQASLKGPCDKAFARHCVSAARSLLPAHLLHVSIVPTLFLYLPKNVWIRVYAGLTTTETAEDNLYNFFVAWREAALHKLKTSGAAPAMDFNPRHRPNPEQMRAFLQKQLPRQTGTTSSHN